MDFDSLLAKVVTLLRAERRVSYTALRRRFDVSAADLEALKDELIHARRQAVDENGNVLVWLPTASPAAAEPDDAERRQLTVMFCDLKDSTRLSGSLDPEDLRVVIRDYQATAARVIDRFGGHIAQYLGDGLLVYFGYPHAHEDDAQRAVRAGLGIIEAVGELSQRLESRLDVRLAVRIGIHTGVVVVGEVGAGDRSETLALGETPNLAARLEQLAAPATVAISDTTRRLLEDRFYLEDLGPQSLKGIPAPVFAYRVLGDTGVRSRFDIAATQPVLPLIGRRSELTQLIVLWERVKAGQGQVALVSGEPGIGKSRLLQALKEHVALETYPWGALRCSPYFRHTALYPVLELWQQQLELRPEQDHAHKLRRLEDSLLRYDLDHDVAVPLFAELLSIEVPRGRYPPVAAGAAQRREAAIQQLVQLTLQMSGGRPFLLVVEDLQWIDPTTAELLTRVAARIAGEPLFAVYTSRAELPGPCAEATHVSRLQLRRLDGEETGRMVLAVTGDRALPEALTAQVVQRTDGVPAFVEELTRSVLESGLLHTGADGVLELRQPLPSLSIPETLRDSLMARLDRLGPAKRLAQLAAVIGRWFSFELLQVVSPYGDGELREGLGKLVSAGLLRQWGDPPDAHYMFRHALIQELAYESLLSTTRQAWHAGIATAMLEQLPSMAEERPELLAHHFTAAGETVQAVTQWHRAGRLALARSTNEEAIIHIERALALNATLPESPERDRRELSLQLSLGPAQFARFGWGAARVGKTYARAHDLSVRLGADAQLRLVLIGQLGHSLLLADYAMARAVANKLDTLAQRDGQRETRLAAHCAAGSVHFYTGELALAERFLNSAVELYGEGEPAALELLYGQDPGVTCGAWLGLVLWLRGKPRRSLAATENALALARSLEHPFSLAFALSWAIRIHALRGDAARVAELARESAALARQHGFALFDAASTVMLGHGRVHDGSCDEGLDMIRQGLDAWRRSGSRATEPYFLYVLAEASLLAGRFEEAADALQLGLERARATGESWWQAELQRLDGELVLAAGGDPERAAAAFRAALETAAQQQATGLELRAATGLAAMWSARGRGDDARRMLAGAIGHFDNECDTADLRRARAIVESLDDSRRAS